MFDFSDFMKFWVEASKVAKKHHASIEGGDAEVFIKELYALFSKQQEVKDKKKWLSEILNHMFPYMEHPPKWKGEPDWPFFDGKPMIFLHQFTIPLSAQHINFPLTDTVYVFALKNQHELGEGSAYKLIIQTEDGEQVVARNNDIIEF